MPRAAIFVMDSFGIGAAADAAEYGDAGSDTLGHIAAHCARGEGDRAGLRHGPLALPCLDRLGLGAAAAASTGKVPAGLTGMGGEGLFGFAEEVSKGKDTPSGHWEIAGCPVPFDWGYFPHTQPTMPASLTAALIAEGGIPGILGDVHASGTDIIATLGEEHVHSGKPIVYTSADSVLQIAAHEESFGLERLYALCQVARRLVDPLNIGRVIARPFTGTPGHYERTPNRRDYAVPPPGETILDRCASAGRGVITVGKIGDIFAHRNVGHILKGNGNAALMDASLRALQDLPDGGFLFSNFIDFDSLYGHRRDVPGYAAALEAFDRRLPEVEAVLRPGDMVIITADHGCDPTWRGTDHTREHVPVLAFGPGLPARDIGRRASFADVGASVAAHLGLGSMPSGRPFV
jgi:phosphopentomutase